MMSRTFKIFYSIIFIFCLIALILLDLFVHNFRTVIPNQVYRSRQLSKQELAAKIKEYHLKSILNLRGAHPGLAWYDNEMAIARKDQVKHYNIALQSEVLPSPAEFKKLVNIIETAPRPILVHCESGVDRSGLAAVISLLLANNSLEQAKKQVSWRYFVLYHDSVGKQFLRDYQKWLQEKHLRSSKPIFLQWLSQFH